MNSANKTLLLSVIALIAATTAQNFSSSQKLCFSQEYLDNSNTCVSCDPECDGCFGSTDSDCIQCANLSLNG